MSRRLIVGIGLAAAVLGAGSTLAQPTPEPRQGAPAASSGAFLTQMPAHALRLSKIVGLEVMGLDHTRLGEIDEIVLTSDGRAVAAVIGVGGVLGMGEKSVALPFDQVLWNTGDVGRAAQPSASMAPANAPSAREVAARGPERMPGAEVSNEVLGATDRNESGRVAPGSGPVTTGSTEPATVPVSDPTGAPERALVRLTRSDLENAPQFRYGEPGQRKQ